MYKFGYYYNFPSQNKPVVLLYDKGLFVFIEVDENMIPYRNKYMTSAYKNLSMPIACRMSGSTIIEIIFLYDIPVSNNHTDEGLTFDIDLKEKHVVLFDGATPLIDNNSSDDKEKKFAHLLEEYVGINKRISMLNGIISFITPDNWRSEEMITRDLMDIIDSYNLEEILSSLYVTDNVHCHFKAGEGYDNTLYHTKSLTDKSIKTDGYINKIIGIGTEKYDCGGYGYQNGGILVYEGEKLEKEKKEILSRYSKTEHMAYLIFSKIKEKESALKERDDWMLHKAEIEDRLNKEFYLDKISSLDQRLFMIVSMLRLQNN